MKFMAFNLADIMIPQMDNIPKVGTKSIDAANLLEARMLASTYKGEWTVIPLDVIDTGRIGHTEEAMADLKGWLQFYDTSTPTVYLQ